MKKIISITLALLLAVLGSAFTVMAEDEIKVTLNGEELEFADQKPIIDEGRTLVPMRAIFEAMGATVFWDDSTKTITSYEPVGDVSIVLQINSHKMFVNEEEITLDVAAKIVNDRTLVPVRAIAEGMNSTVEWDGEARTVLITKEEPSMPNPWQDFDTLEELNAVIGSGENEISYVVSEPEPPVTIDAYRYLESENMAELQGHWDIGESAELVIRTAPGDKDISGIYGGEKLEEYQYADSLVEIYQCEDTFYATWACEDAGTVFSHSVAIGTGEFDAADILKTLVKDIEDHHPKG